jgi:hypothetical protein
METYLGQNVMPVTRQCRLLLGPEALLIEVRGPGDTWVPRNAIPYTEIQAVYSFDTPDWNYAAVALAYWLGALAVLAVAGMFLSDIAGTVMTAGGILATLAVTALATYRIATVPRRVLRIEAHQTTLEYNRRSSEFFRQLRARLPAPAPAAAPPAPTFSVPPPTPPRLTPDYPRVEVSMGDDAPPS